MTVLDKIVKLLDDNKIAYKLIEHVPVYTSKDAAKIRDVSMSMGAKALVMYADKNPVLLVVPGDKKVDFKKFKKALEIKDLRMASHDQVEDLTSLKVGSIPPVGKVLNLKSYYDDSFSQKQTIAFNAGSHTVSMVMEAKDLIRLENPIMVQMI